MFHRSKYRLGAEIPFRPMQDVLILLTAAIVSIIMAALISFIIVMLTSSAESQVVSFQTNTPPVVNQQVSFFTTTPFSQADTIVIGTQIANMTNAAGQALFTISQLTNSFTRLNWTLVWQGHNNGNLGTYTNETSVFTGSGQ